MSSSPPRAGRTISSLSQTGGPRAGSRRPSSPRRGYTTTAVTAEATRTRYRISATTPTAPGERSISSSAGTPARFRTIRSAYPVTTSPTTRTTGTTIRTGPARSMWGEPLSRTPPRSTRSSTSSSRTRRIRPSPITRKPERSSASISTRTGATRERTARRTSTTSTSPVISRSTPNTTVKGARTNPM